MKIKLRSIKTQITLTLVIVMSAVFILLGFVASERLKALPLIVLDQYQEIALSRAGELGNEIQGLDNQIRMISLSNVMISMDLEDIQTYLLSMSRQQLFRNFTFSTPDGIAWATYNQFIDISNQRQFTEIFINKKDRYLSQPFYSPFIPEPHPIITISHAIKNDSNQTIGLINGVVSTRFVDNILKSITFQEDGYAWIIDDQGNVVAHPDDNISIDTSFNQITGLDYSLFSNPNEKTFSFKQNDKTMINVYATIPSTNGWTLILSIDQEQAFSKVSIVSDTINISLIMALIILIIILMISTNRIITPLLNLQNAFEQAKKGDLSYKADESTPNEIGEAAKSFNQMLSQIKELTYIDPITGLNNFFSFLNEIPRLNYSMMDDDYFVYVVILSIDDFKRINSLYGYDVGNSTLRSLSLMIQPYLKENEMIARYFGDEMICSMIARSELEIRQRVEEIVAISRQPFHVSTIEIHLDVSCGVAKLEKNSTINMAIRQATLAKHKAKLDPYTHVMFYSQSIYLDILAKQDLEEAIAYAIEREEFYCVYQPIYHMSQKKIIGYEALLRWNNPDYQNIPIINVIKLAETKGYIHDIGRFVLKEASKQLKRLNEVDPSLYMCVNVSPLQLQNQGFYECALTSLREIRFDPKNLMIEMTESAAMLDIDAKQDILFKLKDLGFKIAIDDFGTGYSSLIYIAKLPIDTIKIDREFISKIESDEYPRALIISILSIAKSLNLTVIAEGVETQDQALALQAIGCEVIQGYYISKPVLL
jgi:diguanylate cyclase (GGDEF)-like protein